MRQRGGEEDFRVRQRGGEEDFRVRQRGGEEDFRVLLLGVRLRSAEKGFIRFGRETFFSRVRPHIEGHAPVFGSCAVAHPSVLVRMTAR